MSCPRPSLPIEHIHPSALEVTRLRSSDSLCWAPEMPWGTRAWHARSCHSALLQNWFYTRLSKRARLKLWFQRRVRKLGIQKHIRLNTVIVPVLRVLARTNAINRLLRELRADAQSIV